MQTIQDDITTELCIKKSRFIAILFSIHSLEDVKKSISESKEKWPDATHYCYAYILENKEKAVDDGEPVGTAGIPILTVLRKSNVNHVLCIVVRYYGGIKLGSGGLIRAYGKACKKALEQATIISLEKGYEVKICFDYNHSKQIDTFLKNSIILKKEFKEKTNYWFKIKKIEFQNICKQLETLADITIIKEDYF